MRTILLTLFISLFSLQYSSQTYSGDQIEIDRILSRSASWSDNYMDGDIRALSELYTDDGMVLPDRALIIQGRDAIAERFQLKEGTTVVFHKARPEEITIEGQTAYDIGYYEGSTKDEVGNESGFFGKYVIIWKKLDGEWYIYADIWNRAPMEN